MGGRKKKRIRLTPRAPRVNSCVCCCLVGEDQLCMTPVTRNKLTVHRKDHHGGAFTEVGFIDGLGVPALRKMAPKKLARLILASRRPLSRSAITVQTRDALIRLLAYSDSMRDAKLLGVLATDALAGLCQAPVDGGDL